MSGCDASAGGVSADSGNIVVDVILVVLTVIALYVAKKYIDLLFDLWKFKLTKKLEIDFKPEQYRPFSFRKLVLLGVSILIAFSMMVATVSYIGGTGAESDADHIEFERIKEPVAEPVKKQEKVVESTDSE